MKTDHLAINQKSAVLIILCCVIISCKHEVKTVKDVMDSKIDFIYKTMDSSQIMSLDYDKVFSFFSKDEKKILATRHWMFDVNVPVLVSVMRSRKPLMAVPGNHDNRSGLGALMYRELFSYPMNAPEGVEKEQTGYPEIRNKWCTLFDRYHVDIVMSGHVHNYLRTKPMKNEKPVASAAEGTVYLVSIAIPDNDPQPPLPYAASQVSGEMLYQKVTIKGNKLDYKAMNIDGVVRDQMTITK